jgi:hypothetical protein
MRFTSFGPARSVAGKCRLFAFVSLISVCIACGGKSARPAGDTTETSAAMPPDAREGEGQLTCWGAGPVEFGDDYEAVAEKVGEQNITADSLFLEGQFDRIVTAIWKGTPRELFVHWKERKAPYNTIEKIEISHPQSEYSFSNGIRVGTALAEIQKLNGDKPLNIYGFGWDYGGTFADFGGGKLKGDIPCFGGVFEVAEGSPAPEVSGDKKISSADPALAGLQVKLKLVRIQNAL